MLDLSSPKTIKSLLSKHGIQPTKSLGQHFLISTKSRDTLIEATDLESNDTVLEIGPGLGVITLELAKKVKRVIAIEKDKRMAALLKDVLEQEGVGNVDVVQGDVLKISPPKADQPRADNSKIKTNSVILNEAQRSEESQGVKSVYGILRNTQNDKEDVYQLIPTSYKLVSNLPYNITGAIFEHFLERTERPKKISVLLQKEVGERIVAHKEGASMLSIAVQFFGNPKIVTKVPRTHFWPSPRVDSVILQVDMFKDLPLQENLIRPFFNFVRAGFSSRRKKLRNNLISVYRKDQKELEKAFIYAKISQNARAEELTVEAWTKLFEISKKYFDK